MSSEDKLASLLTVILNMPEDRMMTISEIADKAGLHPDTAKHYIENFQSIQEFPYRIRMMKGKKRIDIIKIPNDDSNKLVNIKLNRILQKLERF